MSALLVQGAVVAQLDQCGCDMTRSEWQEAKRANDEARRQSSDAALNDHLRVLLPGYPAEGPVRQVGAVGHPSDPEFWSVGVGAPPEGDEGPLVIRSTNDQAQPVGTVKPSANDIAAAAAALEDYYQRCLTQHDLVGELSVAVAGAFAEFRAWSCDGIGGTWTTEYTGEVTTLPRGSWTGFGEFVLPENPPKGTVARFVPSGAGTVVAPRAYGEGSDSYPAASVEVLSECPPYSLLFDYGPRHVTVTATVDGKTVTVSGVVDEGQAFVVNLAETWLHQECPCDPWTATQKLWALINYEKRLHDRSFANPRVKAAEEQLKTCAEKGWGSGHIFCRQAQRRLDVAKMWRDARVDDCARLIGVLEQAENMQRLRQILVDAGSLDAARDKCPRPEDVCEGIHDSLDAMIRGADPAHMYRFLPEDFRFLYTPQQLQDVFPQGYEHN